MMIRSVSKAALFVSLVTAHQKIGIDASLGVSFFKCRFLPSPKHSLSVRGGSSESASSWSAGSRYDYRTTRPSSPTRKYYTPPPHTTDQQSQLNTKEVFAEAFLLREDRNRFIGAPDFFVYCNRCLVTVTVLGRDVLICEIAQLHVFHSQSVCDLDGATSRHGGYYTRFSNEPKHTRLDDLESLWKERQVFSKRNRKANQNVLN